MASALKDLSLLDDLQREFCPPVDSSLIVALLAELEYDADGNSIPVSESQLERLRDTLCQVASHAESYAQDIPDLSGLNLNDLDDATAGFLNDSSTDDSTTTITTTTQTSSVAGTSDSPPLDAFVAGQYPFDSPIGFLQTALPHVSATRLMKALDDSDIEEKELDMWDIVAGILSEEAVREMEERGIDGLDDNTADEEDASLWRVVDKRKAKKMRRSTTLLTLGDVRQKNQRMKRLGTRPGASSHKSHNSSLQAPDAWVQLTSLSEFASTMLPSHPPSFFQSFFHSPEHASPYSALRGALTAICAQNEPLASSSDSGPLETDSYSAPLFNILDVILSSSDGPLDPEEHSKLISDVTLALRATNGCASESLELVQLLRELDADSEGGQHALGVYHEIPVAPSPREHNSNGKSWQSILPSEPPPIEPPPFTKTSSASASSVRTRRKPISSAWQKVPERKFPSDPHRLVQHIPAYASARLNTAHRAPSEVARIHDRAKFMRANAMMRKRDEFLREASRMWQRGNARSMGGDIALYYAQRARQCEEIARKEALEAAKLAVEATRSSTAHGDTIDLHGATVDEAIVIVRDYLQANSPRPGKPLRFVTGRGTHSANRTGVLKPALKKALSAAGWDISTWDAGIVVRGRRTPS